MKNSVTDKVKEYLETRSPFKYKHIISVEELPGGVSADVFRVTLRDGELIIKCPLPRLKVEKDWFSDTKRGKNEFQALRIASRILEHGDVPDPLFYDEEREMLIISAAPKEYVTWKSLLLKGYINSSIVEILANKLALFHNATRGKEFLSADLINSSSLFHELRLSPYFGPLLTIYKDSSEPIHEVIRILSQKRYSLVHGDFSPKNILTDGTSKVVILDWEVIHYGNPIFDLAFMCNHLTLKTFHLGKKEPDRWFDLIIKFYEKYLSAADSRLVDAPEFFKVLGALLLARVDGKSPAEYLTNEDKKLIRIFGLQVLDSTFNSIRDYCSEIREQIS
ncbi:MAG: aminoglycoside phosphotransferase family protein [Nitrososphaerota archaeon]|nr:aminoglycoside phosphotransferase family protein [Nitrososphaerota archaeon]